MASISGLINTDVYAFMAAVEHAPDGLSREFAHALDPDVPLRGLRVHCEYGEVIPFAGHSLQLRAEQGVPPGRSGFFAEPAHLPELSSGTTRLQAKLQAGHSRG